VTSIRDKASSVLLIASLMALMGGPLAAASPHEVCDAMHHACDKVEALASCCCGDRSDANPSRVPTGRIELTNILDAVIAPIPAFIPTMTALVLHDRLPSIGRPPNLPILFSDLRL